MSKSQKQAQIENELNALGYSLARQYVILNSGGYAEASFQTLEAVERWIGKEEQRQIGNAEGEWE